MNTKICATCQQEKSLDLFNQSKSKRYLDGYYYQCKSCKSHQDKKSQNKIKNDPIRLKLFKFKKHEYYLKNKHKRKPSTVIQKEKKKLYDSKYREKNLFKIKQKLKIYYCNNKDKIKEYQFKHKKTMTATSRNRHYKYLYGISLEEYEIMVKNQNNLCSICGNPECFKNRRLAVDHNHTTGKIRALLCSRCNGGLGNFLDNPELLLKAIDYLNKFN